MVMIKIAWRNVWRNKARSLVVMLAVTIGITGALFFAAFGNGMVQQQIKKIIANETSHIQLHHPDFLLQPELKHTLEQAPERIQQLQSNPNIKAVSRRLIVNGMAATAKKTIGVTVVGIQPDQEKKVTEIHHLLLEGNYFEQQKRAIPILISQKMADDLQVKLKSKIILNLPDTSGNVAYGLFRVIGVYRTGNGIFDGQHVFVPRTALAELTGLSADAAHEISILLSTSSSLEVLQSELQTKYPNIAVRNWGEIQPTIKMYASFTRQYSFILLTIILMALIFGIINTMLMVILERTREIGMLRAIGMTRWNIATMIVLETIFLSVVGGILGCILSYGVIQHFGQVGIDLTSEMRAMEDMGFSAIIYPELELTFYIQVTVMVIITAIIASWFPARRAIRLHPATALRAG